MCSGCCASRCGGNPTVVSLDGEHRVKATTYAFEEDTVKDHWEEDIPEWLAQLTPGLDPKEAIKVANEWNRCADNLRSRTRCFVRAAWDGTPCRVLDRATGEARQAIFQMDEEAAELRVRAAEPEPALRFEHVLILADIRNIWLCSDSPLARRIHGAIHGVADANLACLVLIDAPSGPLGMVVRSSETREDFLDGMAVLIASQRIQKEPGLARCDLPGGLPPPEAQLRPSGRSLQSVHLSGPICAWLARIAEEALAPDIVCGNKDGDAAALEPCTGGTSEVPSSLLPQGISTTGGVASRPLSPGQASPENENSPCSDVFLVDPVSVVCPKASPI